MKNRLVLLVHRGSNDKDFTIMKWDPKNIQMYGQILNSISLNAAGHYTALNTIFISHHPLGI